MEQISSIESYSELYRANREQISKGEPAFMLKLREAAMVSFEASGFPHKKDESYKYTHLEPIFQGELAHDFSPRNINFDQQELFRCDVPMLDSRVLTVLNGFFYNEEGHALYEEQNGVIYGSLQEAIRRHPLLVETIASWLQEQSRP